MVDNFALLIALAIASAMLVMFIYIQRMLRNSVMDMWESDSLEAPYVYAIGLVLGAIVFSFFSLEIVDAPLRLAINVTGFLVPVTISLCIVLLRKVRAVPAVVSILLVAAVAFLATGVSGSAIVMEFPWWLAPVGAAAACGYFGSKGSDLADSAALAYLAGSIGVVIGGDIAKIPEFVGKGGDYLVLGGGGVLDFVFLMGVFSVATLWGAIGMAAYLRRRTPARSNTVREG